MMNEHCTWIDTAVYMEERYLSCLACGGKGGQFLPATTGAEERWAPCLACHGSGHGDKIVTYKQGNGQ